MKPGLAIGVLVVHHTPILDEVFVVDRTFILNEVPGVVDEEFTKLAITAIN